MLRIDAGDLIVHSQRLDVADVIDWTLRRFEMRLDGHRIVKRIPAVCVDGDRELLGLALRQLLDNAAKYSPPMSPIEIDVTVHRVDAVVHIAVSNVGPPIPHWERQHIFERFYRGTQAGHVPGTGMGLAIVQQIARAHGGTVSVSSSPDATTAVTLSLPCAESRG